MDVRRLGCVGGNNNEPSTRLWQNKGDLNTFHLNLALGTIRLLIQWVPGFFSGRKCVGLDVLHCPPSSAEVNSE